MSRIGNYPVVDTVKASQRVVAYDPNGQATVMITVSQLLDYITDNQRLPASSVTFDPDGTAIIADNVQDALVWINNYLDSQGNAAFANIIDLSPTFATVAAMIASTDTDVIAEGAKISTKGYTIAGDGGNAEYLVKTTAQAAADGDIIDEIGAGFTLGVAGLVAVLQGNNGVVYVRHFGAKADGVSDDTSAIQAAMTYGAGKTVDFGGRENSYVITNDLNISSNTVYTASGAKIYQSDSGREAFVGADVVNVDIYGFELLGNSPDPLLIDGTNRAIEIYGAHNVRIFNNRILNWGSVGVLLSADELESTIGVERSVVRDNYIYNCTNGVFFYKAANGCAIINNVIEQSGRTGVFIDDVSVSSGGDVLPVTNTLVQGNIITTFGNFANGAGITSGWIENCNISNNMVYGGTGAGISLFGGGLEDALPIPTSDVLVDANTIHDVTRQGIVLVGVIFSRVSNNVIRRPWAGGTGANAGIELLQLVNTFGTTYTTNNEIIGNSIRASGGDLDYGIEIEAGSDNNKVVGNAIAGNTSPAIADFAAGTIVKENTGYVTESSGLATILSGNASVVVNHGLDYIPALGDINVILSGSLSGATYYSISGTPNATSFTIGTNAAVAADVDFGWSVNKT
jgi:hypothetical protein